MSPRSIQDSEIVDTQLLLKHNFAAAANIIGSYHLLLQQVLYISSILVLSLGVACSCTETMEI
jgi:hypothetical protein